MSQTEAKSHSEAAREIPWSPDPATRAAPRLGRRVLALFITLVTFGVAAWLGRAMWNTYVAAPWTRDGVVRAYVVTMAPEVSGRIVALPVADNQSVQQGQVLMVIDPTNYAIAVRLDEAAVKQAEANMQNAERESQRRQELPTLAVTVEQQQNFATQAIAAQAQYQQALANLDQAKVNLERCVIHSPVNGWVTNLLTQSGNFATEGQNQISVVNSDSFWVDGYFEETNVDRIHVGDPAQIKLMGYSQILQGHVDSIARAINVANAQPNGQGLATVNPIFTWVRLAQRIPVRIHIEKVPPDVTLAAGMTATVQIDPRPPAADK
jgi:multidrug resistance efflux pump